MKHWFALAFCLFSLTAFSQSKAADTLLQQATAAYEKKDLKTTKALLNKTLSADSTHFFALLLKAQLLLDEAQYQEVYDTYSRLIALHPNNPIGYSNRGLFLNSILQREAALADLDKALTLPNSDTGRLHLFLNRGSIKFDNRNYDGAYADYMHAFEIDSTSLSVLNGLAAVSDEVGRGDETLGYLQKILQRDSTYIGAWVNMGFKYQYMGDYKTSNLYFDKALQLNPDEPLSYNNRAYNKYMLGNLAGALKDVNQSLKLYPGNSYAYRNRALIYLAQKKKDLACADLEKAVAQGFTQTYGHEVEDLQKKHCR